MGDKYQDFFSKNSENYRNSMSHKKGKDLDILLKMINTKSTDICLDLASGTGFTAVRIAPLSKHVTAYDGTDKMLERAMDVAREEGVKNISFVVGDVEKLPFEDNSFDVVVCRRAAHHFKNKNRFLSESFRVLKPEGRFGLVDFAEPCKDNENLFNEFERLRDHSHVKAEKVSSWKEMIEREGFRNLKTEEIPDKIPFEKWLSPINPDSEEGVSCIEFVERHKEDDLQKMNFDKEKMEIIKERFVIVAIKP